MTITRNAQTFILAVTLVAACAVESEEFIDSSGASHTAQPDESSRRITFGGSQEMVPEKPVEIRPGLQCSEDEVQLFSFWVQGPDQIEILGEALDRRLEQWLEESRQWVDARIPQWNLPTFPQRHLQHFTPTLQVWVYGSDEQPLGSCRVESGSWFIVSGIAPHDVETFVFSAERGTQPHWSRAEGQLLIECLPKSHAGTQTVCDQKDEVTATPPPHELM